MRTTLICLIAALCLASCSKSVDHDPEAIAVLEEMSAQMAQLKSCSFTVHTSFDEVHPSKEVTQRNRMSDVYIMFPDKMYVYIVGDSGRAGLWYNGSQLTFYSFTKNVYDVMDAPSTLIETIDSVHHEYGVEFPAADFLYPDLVADVLEFNHTVKYLGTAVINGVTCDHLLAKNEESTQQLWVTRKSSREPIRLHISYNDGRRFEMTLSNWVRSAPLGPETYEFIVPANATKVSIQTLMERV